MIGIDEAIKRLTEVWRYEHTEKYTGEEIREAIDLAIDTLKQKDDCPLFICNFLERLDEAVDLRSIFEALNATGRQVFIAVPHYYEIKELEGMPYDTSIHTL